MNTIEQVATPVRVEWIMREEVIVRNLGSDFPLYEVPVELRFDIPGCREYRFSLGFSPSGQPGRQVYNGPLVLEFFGYFYPRPSVIAAVPLAETDRKIRDLHIGDIIVIEGYGLVQVGPPRMPMDRDRPTALSIPWGLPS